MSHLHHKVSALIDGELSPGARARALRHARGCDECRREILATLEVKQRLTSLAATEVACDLRDLVRAAPPLPAQPDSGLKPALRRMAVSLGSMSVLVVGVAYVVGAPEATSAAVVTPPVNEFMAEFADTTGLAPLSDPPVVTVADASPAGTGPSTAPNTPPTGPASGGGPVTSTLGTLPLVAPGGEAMAVALLSKAVRAPERVAFRGVRVCSSYVKGGVESFALHVRHVPMQGTRYGVLGAGSPQRPTVFIAEDSDAPAVAELAVDRLAASYDLSVAGQQQLLDRQATVVEARHGGDLRARFWIDDRTGLLLQRDLYLKRHLVRSTGFTSVTTSRHGFMPHLPPELPMAPSSRLSTRIAAALTDRGWTYPARLGGAFRLAALQQVSTAGGVVRADYTDGLSTVAVFEERGSLDPATLSGFRAATMGGATVYVRPGLPMVMVWQSGDTVVSVVTDLPEQTASALVGRFPATESPTSPGLTARVEKGLSRLVSAVAP